MASKAKNVKSKTKDDGGLCHLTDFTIPLMQREAEKKATKIILEARHRKVALMKSVQKEADNEISALKAERGEKLRKHEAKVLGSWGDMEGGIQSSTEDRLAVLTARVEENQEKALDVLLACVLDIHPQLHGNLRL